MYFIIKLTFSFSAKRTEGWPSLSLTLSSFSPLKSSSLRATSTATTCPPLPGSTVSSQVCDEAMTKKTKNSWNLRGTGWHFWDCALTSIGLKATFLSPPHTHAQRTPVSTSWSLGNFFLYDPGGARSCFTHRLSFGDRFLGWKIVRI